MFSITSHWYPRAGSAHTGLRWPQHLHLRLRPASPLQQLVLDDRALGAEMHEEGAGGRACPQLLQLVVVGPLDVAPLLDLRRGRDRLQGDCQSHNPPWLRRGGMQGSGR